MFLKNCWYVAAQPEEIDRTPFARTICNEPIVFWRTEAGEPVAFEDRCCHRRMPLRKGVTVGDRLRCHYHGQFTRPAPLRVRADRPPDRGARLSRVPLQLDLGLAGDPA